MSDIGLLDRRLTEVEELLNRLAVDQVTGKIYLSNVIDFNKAKEKLKNADKEKELPLPPDPEEAFKEIQERNRRNEERIKRERGNANRNVKRDYNIKD